MRVCTYSRLYISASICIRVRMYTRLYVHAWASRLSYTLAPICGCTREHTLRCALARESICEQAGAHGTGEHLRGLFELLRSDWKVRWIGTWPSNEFVGFLLSGELCKYRASAGKGTKMRIQMRRCEYIIRNFAISMPVGIHTS